MKSPDGTADRIRLKARLILDDPDGWLKAEHDLLGGSTPEELLGMNLYEQAKKVENLLDQMMHGMGP